MINPADRQRVGKARLLRRQGKTYSEIRAAIGYVSDDRLQVWLRGIPRPKENYRGGGLDELRRKCRQLRGEGKTYDEIHELTGASVGSLKLWLQDIPYSRVGNHEQRMERFRATCALHREFRLEARDSGIEAAASQIGGLTDRELMFVGAAIYWSEGAKNKPWRVADRVTFINSDPTMITVFLRWLRLMGVDHARCGFRVHIHESADIPAAVKFWADHVEVNPGTIKTTLKRHNPKTVRRNTGETYLGCLIVDVKKSGELYRTMEAAWRAITRSVASDESPEAN